MIRTCQIFGRFEAIYILLLLSALILSEMWLADAFFLFCRMFWYDELLSRLIVTRATIGVALDDIKAGVELSPPGFHLLLRAYVGVIRADNETALRMFSFTWAFVAVAGAYAILREDFGKVPSLAGALAIWAHPILINQAFDIRFYAVWIAALVWYIFFLNKGLQRPSIFSTVATASTSCLLCSLHYFGIVTWFVSTVAVFCFNNLQVVHPRKLRRFFEIGCASMLGPLAFSVWLIFFLPHQQLDFTVPTYLEPPTASAVTTFAVEVMAVAPLPWAALAFFALHGAFLLRQSVKPSNVRTPQLKSFTSILFGAQLAVPILIVLVSFLLRSVLEKRYAIAAVLIHGAVAAYLMSYVRGKVGRAICLSILVLYGAANLKIRTEMAKAADRTTNHVIRLLSTPRAEGVPCVFEDSLEMLRVWWYAEKLRSNCIFLDIPAPPEKLRKLGRFRIFTAEHLKLVSQRFGDPPVVQLAEMEQQKTFFFFPLPLDTAKLQREARRTFASYHWTHICFGRLFLLEKHYNFAAHDLHMSQSPSN